MSNKIFYSLFLLLCIATSAIANDGSYFVSGNHLIPMFETKISVRKEILSIKRVNDEDVQINVYYEFFNPEEAKEIEVGFEASTPQGDADVMPIKGRHPFIYDFTVNMNNKSLPFEVSLVNDSVYYKNGKFLSKTEKEIKADIDDVEPNFKYVYHFKTKFNKGINIIKHSYRFKMSTGVFEWYNINYVLTAAKRWANKQIDDFSLTVDMGNYQTFKIDNTFFNNFSEWIINGLGKCKTVDKGELVGDKKIMSTIFSINDGFLFYFKKNFKPSGELNIISERQIIDSFDYKQNILSNQVCLAPTIAVNEVSFKILKKLPFAVRGYVFSNPELSRYFESTDWYIPNPAYLPDMNYFSKQEMDWIKKLKNVSKNE